MGLGGRVQQNESSDLRGMMKLFLGMSLEAEGCVTNRNSNKSRKSIFYSSWLSPFSVLPCLQKAVGKRNCELKFAKARPQRTFLDRFQSSRAVDGEARISIFFSFDLLVFWDFLSLLGTFVIIGISHMFKLYFLIKLFRF